MVFGKRVVLQWRCSKIQLDIELCMANNGEPGALQTEVGDSTFIDPMHVMQTHNTIVIVNNGRF